MVWPCNGCRKSFQNPADLAQHYQRTTNDACNSPPPSTLVSNVRPVAFEGDFFGDVSDYQEEDLPFDGSGTGSGDHPLAQVLKGVAPVQEGSDDEDEADLAAGDALEDIATANEAPDPPSARTLDPSSRQPPHAGPDDMAGIEVPSAPGGLDLTLHEQLRAEPAHAGTPLNSTCSSSMPASGYQTYGAKVQGSDGNPYAPFRSEIDWKIAQWAKMQGPGSNAFSDLLAIKGVVETLGLSYKNTVDLNNIIDAQIPHRRPAFSRFTAEVMGEKFEMYARPLLECILALYSDPEHVRYLCFAPERHYADADKTIRLYHDVHTGQWWWSTQKQLESEKAGATVIPIILSSDKTQVTLFRNKTAYPVYVTIGNLPKSVRSKPKRQGQILLAYLPTSRLDHISNQAARRRAVNNLFHACMRHLLEPIRTAGIDGILMTSGDGITRRCHPILMAYVGDYPEQCLVACAFNGDCPICQCPHSDLGIYPTPHPYRDMDASREAVNTRNEDPDRFVHACDEVNIKPVQRPFWADLPYTDIFRAITSDVLHQLYQGVFKHLIAWLKSACGTGELDARIARLPPNHSIRIFYKGISHLSRISGAEHRQISRFLLSVVVDMDLPGGRETSHRLVRATRALLDFVFLAQYPVHSSATLDALDRALASFHAERDVFITLGIRTGFNIPKLHALEHYSRCIKLYGTTDNYNTETSERLHIDFTKEAYRATNHKDEYPQMTKWLERREKIMHHANFVIWREQQATSDRPEIITATSQHFRWAPPDLAAPLEVKMTRHPTRKSVPLADITGTSSSQYGARYFIPALARFVILWHHPDWTAGRVEYMAEGFISPLQTLPVFHRVKLRNEAIFGNETVDSVHVHPRLASASGGALGDTAIPARFDTALVRVRVATAADETFAPARTWTMARDLSDTRVVQVRVVFTLPDAALDRLFPTLSPDQRPPRHLAYVEWFSRFTANPDHHSKMYKVTRSIRDSQRVASIIPVRLIERSIHLTPKWPGEVPRHWTSETVLEECSSFYVNPFKDGHTYFNVY
ncbi:hypothetical protein C8Q77DRAFT_1224356 [Trametes polyzona]|nr:hypothetical protein C8Q77DRAFT_1224356 [Trametes polyzona]